MRIWVVYWRWGVDFFGGVVAGEFAQVGLARKARSQKRDLITDWTTVPSCRRWVAKIHSGGEPINANAHIDADARDPVLVPGFKSVSAQAFVVYRVDPHVVVFCPSALGGCVVGFSSQGAGSDLYPCAPRVRLVVLDTPGDGCRGVGWLWCFS
jgi:hypothetical protein